jgi:succinate dehydrogenase / fumarate reductase cytochrome b subunit
MSHARHDRIKTPPRPLSPHLQVYRPMFTMMMSIAHRISGAALYLGFILIVVWLVAAAVGPDAYAVAHIFVSGWFGTAILIFFTWALIHHMLGGIRHFIWDTGRGFSRPAIEWLAQATLLGGILITAMIWISAYVIRPGI